MAKAYSIVAYDANGNAIFTCDSIGENAEEAKRNADITLSVRAPKATRVEAYPKMPTLGRDPIDAAYRREMLSRI
jgi:hypothetical protein